MVKVDLTPLRKRFDSEMKKSFDLIAKINQIKPPLPSKYVFSIVELSFLKTYLAWELFLEESFIRYMIGGKTSTGYKVVSYVNPKTRLRAREFIKEGKNYANCTPDEIIRKANLFFKEEPYGMTLRPIISQLNEMKCIRNRITHGSHHSNEKFKSLVRSKASYAPNGITVGAFLLKIESRSKF